MSKATNFFTSIGKGIAKHSPGILVGLGIAGSFTSVVLAVSETPKALDILAKEEKKKGEKLTKKEAVKATWKVYIPAAVTFGISSACIVGAQSINLKRNATLAAVATLTETSLKQYKDIVMDTVDEETAKEIKEKVAQKKVDDNPVSKQTVIVTGNGDCLCYEPVTGRYFRSSVNKIDAVINDVNRVMLINNYASLNDLCDELGLARVNIGDQLGWQVDKGYIHWTPEATISDNGEPVITLDYDEGPYYNYDMFA